jgi:N-acetylneuraminic acid mutarotase
MNRLKTIALVVASFTALLISQSFATITWSPKRSLPQALAGSGGAVIGDTMYVIGGRDSSGNRYATNYLYIVPADSWAQRAPIPTPRAHVACAAVNGKIYVIGGWVGSTATNVVEEYDPATNVWRSRTAMPTPRYTLGAAVANNMIYCIGGMNMSGSIFSTIEVYDPVADTWAVKTPMPTARMGLGAGEVNGKIYVVGGSNLSQALYVNEEFDPALNTWTSKASIPTRRYCLGCFSYGNKVYGLGGYDYLNYNTTVEAYTPATNTWASETPMQNARQSMAVGLKGDRVYVIGGWNNGAVAFNEEGVLQGTGAEEASSGEVAGGRETGLEVYPNPITQAARITVRPGRLKPLPPKATLKIYDAQGRMVRQLSLTHPEVFWDGKDGEGTPVASGIYFVQLWMGEAGERAMTQRVVLVR